jgi:hypothetical protein
MVIEESLGGHSNIDFLSLALVGFRIVNTDFLIPGFFVPHSKEKSRIGLVKSNL